MSGGKREQHAGERRVPGTGKAASARAFALFAAVAAATLAIDIALISARLFFSCGSRTLRRLPSSSSILNRSNVNASARRCGCRARACRRGCGANFRGLLLGCGATGCFALALGGIISVSSTLATHFDRKSRGAGTLSSTRNCNAKVGGAVGAVVILHAAGQDLKLRKRRAEGAAGDAPKRDRRRS